MCKLHNEVDMGNEIFNGVCPVCLKAENEALKKEITRLTGTVDVLKSALHKLAWETPVSDVNFSWQQEWHRHRVFARDALKEAGFESTSQRQFRREKIKQHGHE